MKKILVVVALAVFSFANAQKGSVLVMGSIMYNSQNDSNSNFESKQNFFGFQPKVGYQFQENWTAGIEGNISNSKNDLNDGSLYKDHVYKLGGFLRYSKPLGGIFSAYADLGLGYKNRKETFRNTTGQTYNDSDGFYASLTPALFIDIKKGFGLNFNIGGLNYSALNTDLAAGMKGKTKTFEFNFGQSFSIGVSKNF
ncbi:outer membrane beta-barrel protein [Flavobacterium sp. KACC 22761]|uniref:outer membrane beta-barrel protein n=1 Tax=Flavobacterium sp. KACC 22761 TaxID=3092665 RepID=UPI002A75FC84|nr:outer membrane beta-barrel protein [Flavobacterium sp. KACC 22761]WPO80593.1 outer membrane beta-barrel protein [Flavobacterium sp. KACC 22761]